MLKNTKLPIVLLELAENESYEDLLYFISENIYPIPKTDIDSIPKCRIRSPLQTKYDVGDLVKFKEGPAKGRVGVVVVDRNGNYTDYMEGVRKGNIGVFVTEKPKINPALEQIIFEVAGPLDPYFGVARWVDDPSDLELVKKSRPLKIQEAQENCK